MSEFLLRLRHRRLGVEVSSGLNLFLANFLFGLARLSKLANRHFKGTLNFKFIFF